MTNFERIKEMSVEEMAEFICSIYDDDVDICNKNIAGYTIPDYDEDSIGEWLNSEAEK